MPIYKWVAETKKGKVIKGELEAADEKIARSQLRRRNLNVTKLKPKPKDLFENVSWLQPKVGSKDTEDICLNTGHIGIYVSSKCQEAFAPKIAAWLMERDETPPKKTTRKKASGATPPARSRKAPSGGQKPAKRSSAKTIRVKAELDSKTDRK